MARKVEPHYPRGDLTIKKIVGNYYDLMDYAGARVLAKNFFCYQEYQEYWMKVSFMGNVCWVQGRFGLNATSDMMLGELMTAYAIPEQFFIRLKNVGQGMIKTRGMSQEVAIERASIDLGSNPEKRATIEWLIANAINSNGSSGK